MNKRNVLRITQSHRAPLTPAISQPVSPLTVSLPAALQCFGTVHTRSIPTPTPAVSQPISALRYPGLRTLHHYLHDDDMYTPEGHLPTSGQRGCAPAVSFLPPHSTVFLPPPLRYPRLHPCGVRPISPL